MLLNEKGEKKQTNMKTIIYVVTAYRFGNREKHSYVIGAFSKKAKAIKAAEDHTDYRGGKYSCHVEECVVDHFDNKDDEHSKAIYETKIPHYL